MSDTIDIITKKKWSETNTKFEKNLVLEAIEKNIFKSWEIWVKFQQSWANSAYNTFKDYDKYLVLIFLMRELWQSLSDKFTYQTIDEFYSQDEHEIEKINLIQISQELHIPKETIRRKINELQKEGILKREKKKIFLNRSLINLQKPVKSLDSICTLFEKTSRLLQNEQWFGNYISKEKANNFVQKYFTICWLRFLKTQINFLVNHRIIHKDLETWNVWGVIAINHQYHLHKIREKNIFKDNDEIDNVNYLDKLIKTVPIHGINASSISDISGIPRATVIRKIKWLIKENLIKKNKQLEYLASSKGRRNKLIHDNFLRNQKELAGFLTDMFDLMKNSNFKI